MTTKTVRIMFYDQDTRSFVVETMEIDDADEDQNEDNLQKSQNNDQTRSFSTLL